ncbi:hypothetical protein DPMN_105897 [Dreissena polymorpha]|uniref:Uncharacterized protein n=1 Tax=Dreissena polymorpha TaxID=45954 RepID=A0A9D4QJ59_DREPO|nr:hypothetical protein DPMN_105897 [Dreissena polymorpha]
MSSRGRGVRRRVGQAVAKRGQSEGRGMRAAVDPAPVKEQRAKRLRRNATETAPVPEPAPNPPWASARGCTPSKTTCKTSMRR